MSEETRVWFATEVVEHVPPDPPILDKWSVIVGTDSPYLAPELQKTHLAGTVYNHPHKYIREDVQDGKPVRTSSLVMLDAEKRIARTRNTFYKLGDPCPQWLKWLEENGHKLKDYKKCETKTPSTPT